MKKNRTGTNTRIFRVIFAIIAILSVGTAVYAGQSYTTYEPTPEYIHELMYEQIYEPVAQFDVREGLRAAIVEAEGRNQADYTASTWARMQSALTGARNVYFNETATEAQILEFEANLRTALGNLVRVQIDIKEGLRSAIVEAEARIQGNYTPLTWARMQSALMGARNVYSNPTATEAQILNFEANLRTVMNNLVRR